MLFFTNRNGFEMALLMALYTARTWARRACTRASPSLEGTLSSEQQREHSSEQSELWVSRTAHLNQVLLIPAAFGSKSFFPASQISMA